MKQKKIVMYIDNVKSTHKDVLKEALNEYKTLQEMKAELQKRFSLNGEHKITFKVE